MHPRVRTQRFQHVLRVEAFQRRKPELKQLGQVGSLPRYASGLHDVDLVAGGLYGLAVAGGPPKTGKSLLALRVGLDTAARDGALVVYVDFELDRYTFTSRLLGATGVRSPEELPLWAAENLRVIDGADSSAEELADQIAMQIDEQAERVLIVIDSLNRMAKNQQRHKRGGNYFQHLGEIVSWARNTVTLTGGEVGCLLVSEVNRAGGITGQDPEYAADCFLTLQRTDSASEVEIEFTSRSTAGFSARSYRRDGHAARFEPVVPVAQRAPSASPAERASADDSFGGPESPNLFDMATYRKPKGG